MENTQEFNEYPASFTGRQKAYLKFKYGADFVLALIAGIILVPVFCVISLLIFIDDPGPILFRQKRVGIHKTHFMIWKFRTMKTSTPHDMPTHLLENPEQYITRVGSVLRKTSLDELPQIFNIIQGKLSICSPRPALWNQYDLIAERDLYGANDIRPGLTGWAQIHGRDELGIAEKAKLDGYYVQHIGLWIDLKCFFRTFLSVLREEGVVEGGTGELHKNGSGEGSSVKKTASVKKANTAQKASRKASQETRKKKERVLILTNHSFMLWQFRRELIAELLKTKTVVLSMPCGEHTDDFKALGCKIIDTPVDRRGINPATDLKLMRFYFDILEKVKPNMVITYSIKPNIYGGYACSKKGIPYCVNVQGLGTAFEKKMLAPIVTVMYRIALRKAKTVFFENEENAAEFRRRKIVSSKKQTILHGAGINLEYYPYAPYEEENGIGRL